MNERKCKNDKFRARKCYVLWYLCNESTSLASLVLQDFKMFNLKEAASKKKKGSYGLNKRGKKSVFGNDSSSDEDETPSSSTSRQNFNKDLLAEQAALRKRAEQGIDSSSGVYNYDEEYESFSAGHAFDKATQQPKEDVSDEKPKSRYIENLLQKAKERQYEREIVLERKIAKEQAEEDLNADYRDKDKFVTKSYKRKLEEREAWLKQDAEKQKRDEERDVSKQNAGVAMMGFYGNLSRIGAGHGEEEKGHEGVNTTDVDRGMDRNDNRIGKDNSGDIDTGKSEVDNTSTSRQDESYESKTHRSTKESFLDSKNAEEVEIEYEIAHQSLRVQTLQKIFKARDRYLKRNADREEAIRSN